MDQDQEKTTAAPEPAPATPECAKMPCRPGRMYSWFLGILFVLALFLICWIFSPFVHTVIFAVVLAAIFYPLFTFFSRNFQGRNALAAICVLLIIVFCIFIPLFSFITGLVTQGAESTAKVNEWIKKTDFNALLQQSKLDLAIVWLEDKIPFVDFGDLDLQASVLNFSRKFGQTLIQWGTKFIGNALTLSVHFLLMVFIIFFLLKDGKRWMAEIKRLCPLREDQEDAILFYLRRVAKSVLVGGLLIALLQGLVGGIGLAIVGVPALFWGAMMGLSSLVPLVGTGLVWVPASLYLLIVAKWKAAIFLFLWCAVLVTSIDTFLRPYFMKGASGMSTLFIFLSVIGGLQVFGAAGILYGPLILSFAMVMLKIYGEEFRGVLGNTRDGNSGTSE